MRARGDVGETLIEVLFTIVIVSLTVASLLSSLGTVSRAGAAHRSGVQADVVMRNYAEATKAAVQQQCVGGASTFTVVYQQPDGFAVTGAATGSACPITTAVPLTPLQLKVTDPQGRQLTMFIKLRTP
ncbi:MAG: type II secretion system protein [Ilumatobacteraceae bacterium]